MHEFCSWVDLQVWNTYDKYLMSDTRWSCKYDKAKNKAGREAKYWNRELEEA